MNAPSLSRIGREMSQLSGVRAIMKDIIETLRAGAGQNFIDLSAGNPTLLPAVEQLWRDCTHELLDRSEYGAVVSRYGSSQGYAPLIEAVVNDFNQRYGLNLSDRHILITPGSQALYFYIANAFGGQASDGSLRKIVLPLSPEYTGYSGVTLFEDALVAYQPALDCDDRAHRFKYRPDFDCLQIDEHAGCVLLSRPCNPTGNILTDAEVRQIADLAAARHIPVAIDSAYAPPYPALNFAPLTPQFGSNILHCLSLSKAGLPGERIGIGIGDPQLIAVLEAFQTNLCIHSARYGQAIAARAIESGRLHEIATEIIRPHYRQKFAVLEATLDEEMPSDLPWYLHRAEGGIFAWLWFRDLPITDWDLYQQLKAEEVIAVPGSPFFPGLRAPWAHAQQCLRFSLTATPEAIAEGMRRLARVVERVYRPAIASV
ncbi:alanine-alpha-ketoisovalerate (or valine-pyruvate) aminotransferase [Rubidibacter lacunae KORDI 51-2]|uniref:Alanine-alpha-ketoisovalerate (Or valine-pyruvate) aminotransferase n=1 Tax=Rubidibacter lacunae KORDI 51-2 TaxID=582515 RepID=U5DRD4_9CHRO|nr:valine--pyruvate transaminase [Rubidibacter lacunae]ERN43169.1 alanine-alpha-ketoisovalerate (or valine-pyruvate) aminotransferase [Rubidibacter lacunae KORDI 51-2]